ncbi:MAG: FtsL-like putative cell division protein [Bacteroidota bacterium]
MAQNTYKNPVRKAEAKAGKGHSVFKLIETYVRLDVVFENGLPVKYIPYILYLTAITIFYIGNTHHADKTIRRLDKTKTELDELRADYTTLKSDYMKASMQSEVAKKVMPLGLYESSVPPYKIVIENKD